MGYINKHETIKSENIIIPYKPKPKQKNYLRQILYTKIFGFGLISVMYIVAIKSELALKFALLTLALYGIFGAAMEYYFNSLEGKRNKKLIKIYKDLFNNLRRGVKK